MASDEPQPGVFTEARMFGYDFTAVFDDNGRVAYAFLCYQEDIITDVWLYNVLPAPDKVGLDAPPHLNGKAHIKPDTFPRIQAASEVEFRWNTPGDIKTLYVDVYLRGELHARLKPDEQPGWCRLATEDTDLARVLTL